MRFVLLIVGVEFFVPRHHASVERMRFLPRYLHHDRLLHAVRKNFSHHFLVAALRLCCCFRHYRFSVALDRLRSAMIVFTRAISLRIPRSFFRLSVCPMFSWNFSLNSWSANSRSWLASSSSVRFLILSTFINKFSALRLQLSAAVALLITDG